MLLVTDDLSSWNKILWLYLHESWATNEQQHSPFFLLLLFSSLTFIVHKVVFYGDWRKRTSLILAFPYPLSFYKTLGKALFHYTVRLIE
jgi:hypothetical protein